MACNQRYLVEIKFAAKGAHKMRRENTNKLRKTSYRQSSMK